MGLFDKLKKKDEEVRGRFRQDGIEDGPEIYEDEKGNTVVVYEVKDTYSKGRKHYADRRKLIIKDIDTNIKNATCYDCDISYYGETDAIVLGTEGRRGIKYSILAQLDMHLMKTDIGYRTYVMERLLDEDRIMKKYLKVEPLMTAEDYEKYGQEIKCGKYIGGVMPNGDGTFKNFYSLDVGKQSYNSPEMKLKRENDKVADIKAIERTIEEKRELIEKLTKEIEELEAKKESLLDNGPSREDDE